jgi:hypothetical protein
MDTLDIQLTETTTTADTLPMLAEPMPAPFTCELGGETTHHATFEAACKHVVDKLGPVHTVMRRDFRMRSIGVWREEYNPETEPAAVIAWAKGARL